VYTLVTSFTTSAYGQSPAGLSGLEKEVADVKAENAAVREQLRKMEEQQKALVEMIDRLQRRLDGQPRRHPVHWEANWTNDDK
jgi:septal ring factor EnvC (AmiA/AmiB activator)